MGYVYFHIAMTTINLAVYFSTGLNWSLFTAGMTTGLGIASFVHYLQWRNFM